MGPRGKLDPEYLIFWFQMVFWGGLARLFPGQVQLPALLRLRTDNVPYREVRGPMCCICN